MNMVRIGDKYVCDASLFVESLCALARERDKEFKKLEERLKLKEKDLDWFFDVAEVIVKKYGIEEMKMIANATESGERHEGLLKSIIELFGD